MFLSSVWVLLEVPPDGQELGVGVILVTLPYLGGCQGSPGHGHSHPWKETERKPTRGATTGARVLAWTLTSRGTTKVGWWAAPQLKDTTNLPALQSPVYVLFYFARASGVIAKNHA